MGNIICIYNKQNGSECIPGSRIRNALSWNRVSELIQDDYMYIKEPSEINHAWQLSQSINQLVTKSHMWGSHQDPI